jgi:uncharacterized protein with HEPN domain
LGLCGPYAGYGQKALDYTQGLGKVDYDKDEALRLALTHLVQTLGEAAQHVSASFREAHPEIPWYEIIGMRHRIVHDYLNVNEDVIWEVARQDLPALVTALNKIIPPEEHR